MFPRVNYELSSMGALYILQDEFSFNLLTQGFTVLVTEVSILHLEVAQAHVSRL